MILDAIMEYADCRILLQGFRAPSAILYKCINIHDTTCVGNTINGYIVNPKYVLLLHLHPWNIFYKRVAASSTSRYLVLWVIFCAMGCKCVCSVLSSKRCILMFQYATSSGSVRISGSLIPFEPIRALKKLQLTNQTSGNDCFFHISRNNCIRIADAPWSKLLWNLMTFQIWPCNPRSAAVFSSTIIESEI